MPLSLVDLDVVTRGCMLEELDRDVQQNTLYLSSRLTAHGQGQYGPLLRAAIQGHDVDWLAYQLRATGALEATEPRNTKGGIVQAKVPVNAPEMLAEGEFNRFYIRGLCRRAIAQGVAELVVYRAKPVQQARPDSERKIGARVNPVALLQDLRSHPGVDTALGLPNGPNSGLSLQLP